MRPGSHALGVGMSMCAGLAYNRVAYAAGAQARLEKFTQLMSTPGGMICGTAVGILIGAAGIRIAAVMTGARGGFGLCIFASIVALILSYGVQLVLGSAPPLGLALLLTVLTSVLAVKLCLEASWGQALMTSVLSWAGAIVIALGVSVVGAGLSFI
jgi:hypothetical protein